MRHRERENIREPYSHPVKQQEGIIGCWRTGRKKGGWGSPGPQAALVSPLPAGGCQRQPCTKVGPLLSQSAAARKDESKMKRDQRLHGQKPAEGTIVLYEVKSETPGGGKDRLKNVEP